MKIDIGHGVPSKSLALASHQLYVGGIRVNHPMKIDRIDLFHVAMPLIYPWRTAYGEDADCHSVLCRMTSGSIEAWGESAALAAPCYCPEWAGGMFAVSKQWLA